MGNALWQPDRRVPLVWIIFGMTAMMLAWGSVASVLMYLCGYVMPEQGFVLFEFSVGRWGMAGEIAFTCAVAPIAEEAAFRLLPGILCTKRDGTARYRLVALAVSVLLFAFLHGRGLHSLVIQGALGLALMTTWYRSGPNRLRAYASCVAVHGLYNFITFVLSA